RRTLNLLFAVFGAFLLFYLCYQIYMAVSPSYKTEIAVWTSVSDSVQVDGLVLRDETVVEAEAGSLLGYRFADGEKVPSGAVIADVYSSAADAERARVYEKLSLAAETYLKAADRGRTAGSNLESLRSRIYQNLSSLSSELALQSFPEAYEDSLELIDLLASYIYASGGSADFSVALSEAQADMDALGSVAASSQIVTPVEGYFISYIDGYETLPGLESALEASASQIASLIKGEAGEISAAEGCKLVSDYRWYFAALLNEATAERLEEGESLSVDFSFSAVEPLPMELLRLEALGEGEWLAVLECDYLTSALCALRLESARINFSSYSGVKVSRSALRLVDGELGVYIKYGSQVRFRMVEVIYETDDYVISEVGETDSGLLALYDEIIVEGRDLYEGKQL
ncbi:MAG: HlyD family efflux transporter periplasmic adaptor subunit, partial [Oscillospiraceae bacterium]|nr:HlyD family efflux transporter periplasmic adaptor subunit [Oscillospiraceae bacterium]